MNIVLYKNNSERNKLDKNIINATTIIGQLKESTDILNPTFIVEYNQNYYNFNYVHVPVFNRYYYIENINVVGKTLELSLHVDVLMSHKNDIKQSKATITRSDKGSVYLNDNRIVNTAQHSITHRRIGTGFTKQDVYGLVLASRF